MIRYEASLMGSPVIGEPFTNFDELKVLEEIFVSLNWEYQLIMTGRGGYHLFEIILPNEKLITLHIYLKRVTFGGRESRPYEKRAQFSAALDRRGFDVEETTEEFSVILGIYKTVQFPDVILCAWDIHDWGHNIGRAFNCFVDVTKINQALNSNEIVQHRTSIGQIACCFKPEFLPLYLNEKKKFHDNFYESNYNHNPNSYVVLKEPILDYTNEIPNYTYLFQISIDILKNHDGIAHVDTIESDAADTLRLTEAARFKIHNQGEGYRTELGYQLAWARFYLKKSALIESPKRSIWALTDLGWNLLQTDREAIIKTATQKEIQHEIEIEDLQNIESENDIESETDIDNTSIENPFDPNEVDIRTRTMSLDLILKRLRKDAIDMNTSFQRKANLWNFTKQSRLIESILVRFPLPAFYFDGSDDDRWLVVDGLQRLSSLDNYVNKELFGLQNLEFLSQFNGKKFTELPGYLQRRIEEFEITAYVIAAGTPKVLKFNVFKRINTGGLTLTSQEIRNALNQGKPSQFVKKLADLRSFKIATSFTISEDRMLDQEFVTRFLAFYLLDVETYSADLDSFLNKGMDQLNNVDDIEKVEKNFDKAMNAAISIFGNRAFRKIFKKRENRKPINKALFEVWSVTLSKLDDKEISILIKYKEILIDSFILLFKSESFNKSITSATGDKTRIKKRFSEINNIVQSVLQLKL